jgi:hypothetical protein
MHAVFEHVHHRRRAHGQVFCLCEHPERAAPPQGCLQFGGA